MINAIISAISASIYDEFGGGYEIYKEKIEQGLKEPCFLLNSLSQSSKQFFSARYKKNNLFSIQYFPSTNEVKAECNDVAERLNNCLEWIDVNGDLIRGTNSNSEVQDDILNYSINYNVFTISKSKNDELISEYSIENDVKKDGLNG